MKKILIFICLSIIYSCSNEFENYNVDNPESLSLNKRLVGGDIENENNLKSEMTLLVSRVLNSANARQEVTDFVKVVDTIYNTVSISALLNSHGNLSYLEIENLDYLDTDLTTLLPNEFFKRNLLHEIKQSGTTDYPNLIGNLDVSIARDDQIIDQLVSYDLTLFFPDLELFDWRQVTMFKSTFVPSTEDGENQALIVGTIEIGNTDDLDVCNCNPESPNNLTLIEGDDFTEDFASVIIEETSHDQWDFTYSDAHSENNTYPFGNSSSDSGYGPPPVNNPTVLLDYNFNHTNMGSTNYLLFSGIPRMQVRDGWRRWGNSKTRLRIYRASSTFSTNSSGVIIPTPGNFLYSHNPSRRSTRKKRWRQVNFEWDPNIEKEENSQQIVILQRLGFQSTTTVSVSTKNNINSQGQYSTETTSSVSHTIQHDRTKYRASRELNLTNLCVHNVGGHPIFEDETYDYNNVDDQTVIEVGEAKFFFEFYFKDLSN